MKTYIQFSIIALILSSFLFVNELQAEEETKKKKSAAVEKKVKKQKKPPKKTEDYSKGFAKFAKFGLPNVKDAKYIKLNMYSSALSNSDYFRYQAKVAGNAWMMSENKKSGKAEIVINQGAVATVYDQQKLMTAIMEKRRKEAKKKKNKKEAVSFTTTDFTEGKLAGSWEKADLKKDADKITEHISKEMQKEYFYGKDSLGIWFLFAIHLDQKGLKKEANELAGVLFEAGKGKRIVILQALNVIADAQYGVAYAKFKDDHDWKSYAATVNKTYKTFKRGWKKAAGIKKLLDLIVKRAAEKATIEIEAKWITKAEKALIKELIEKPLKRIPSSIWVLKETTKKTVKEGKEKEKDKETVEPTTISKITDGGMTSVPLLIKLLGNETLIVADKNDIRSFGGRTSYSSNSGSTSNADKIFKKLNRPMTLGEIARKLLDPIVIQEIEIDNNGNEVRRSSDEDDTDEFREVSETWYKANKKKSTLELARSYLKNGSKAQKASAVSYLLKKKIKSEYPIIEKFLLSGKRNKYGNSFQDKLAIRYAGSRGVEAKPFAEKYIEKLDPDGEVQKAAKEAEKKAEQKKDKKKSETKKKKSSDNSLGDMFTEGASSDNNSMSKWEREQILKTIEQLKAMTSDESVEDIIDDILGDKRKWDAKQKNLLATRLRMSDNDIDSKLAVILKSAYKAAKKNREKIFSDLLSMAVRIKNNIKTYDTMFNFSSQSDDLSVETKEPDPLKNSKIWKKLIGLKIFQEDYNDQISITAGDAAAIIYDSIYSKKPYVEGRINLYIFGDRLSTLMRQRALKRIAGVAEDKLPKLPSIDDLTEEQREKQIADVLKKVRSSQNKKQAIDSLSLNEILLLKLGTDKDKKLSSELFKLSNKVVKVKSDLPGAKKFAKFANKQFSTTMVDQIKTFAIESQRNNKNIYCRIYREPILGGFSIFIGEIPKKKLSPAMNDKKKDAKIIMVGVIKMPGAFNARAYWPLTEEKEVAKVTKSSEDDDLFGDMEEEIQNESKDFYAERQVSFNEKIKQLQAGKLNSLLTGGIYFSGGVE